jgi:hypothetical protein
MPEGRLKMRTATEIELRELGHRHNDGLDITLFWNAETDDVFVVVEDQRDGKAFKLDVAATDALDAFRHPFAYVRDDEDRALEEPIPRSWA